MNNSKTSGSGGIRTHASEETGALNQRLRPLGHATYKNTWVCHSQIHLANWALSEKLGNTHIMSNVLQSKTIFTENKKFTDTL